MPRDYQLKRTNPYHIDNANIYREVLYIIKDYYNLLSKRLQILMESPAPADGMPGGNGISDPTFAKAKRLYPIENKLKAIEGTVELLTEKYKDTCTGEKMDAYRCFIDYPTFCYFRSRPTRDEAPSTRTWMRYRSEFVWNVAKKLNYL